MEFVKRNNFVVKMLDVNDMSRLKKHRFFEGINWSDLTKMSAPTREVSN